MDVTFTEKKDKIVLKDIQNTWIKKYAIFIYEKSKILKYQFSSKLNYIFNTIPIKIPMVFFFYYETVVLVTQWCLTLCNPMDCVAHQVPLPMGFSTQDYWSCHSLLQGIFPTQGQNTSLQHCRQILNHLSHLGSLL